MRGTLRSLARADAIKTLLSRHADEGKRVEFVVADLRSDAGWADAMRGVRFVLHVASPFPQTAPKHPDDLIVTERDWSDPNRGAAKMPTRN